MRIRIFGRVLYVSKAVCATAVILVIAIATIVGLRMMKEDELPELTRAGETDSGVQTSFLITPTQTPHAVLTPSPDRSTPVPPAIAVHITGEIANPGVYRTYEGAILQDLVDLAGGLTEKADTYVINLAIRVRDGMRIHIPSVDDESKIWLIESGRSDGSSGPSPHGTGLVNINTAGLDELMTLSGIGEAMAADIINYRNEHGYFTTIEDIMNVPGIKEAKFARIKNQITV